MPVTIIHARELEDALKDTLTGAIPGELEPRDGFFRLHHSRPVAPDLLAALRARLHVDLNRLPAAFEPAQARLLVSDMDSTLITIECVDEIADFVGVKPQVAAITEAAMRGEIDFETSLTLRVALLKGLPATALQRVYDERLYLTPGSEEMLARLRARGVKIGLVSGGFTFFTERLHRRLGLDYSRANELEVIDDQLTGKLLGPIVGAEAKERFLHELCEQQEIGPSQAVALGDGANDLKMMDAAGLSVAYRAKPKVQVQADAIINYCGLEAVAHLLEG